MGRVGERKKRKIRFLRHKDLIQGLGRLSLGWKAGVHCRHSRRRSEGHVVAGGLVSAAAQVKESFPKRLQGRRENKQRVFMFYLRTEVEKNRK